MNVAVFQKHVLYTRESATDELLKSVFVDHVSPLDGNLHHGTFSLAVVTLDYLDSPFTDRTGECKNQ